MNCCRIAGSRKFNSLDSQTQPLRCGQDGLAACLLFDGQAVHTTHLIRCFVLVHCKRVAKSSCGEWKFLRPSFPLQHRWTHEHSKSKDSNASAWSPSWTLQRKTSTSRRNGILRLIFALSRIFT